MVSFIVGNKQLLTTSVPKLSSYLSSGVFQELLAIQQSVTVVNPDQNSLDTINKLLPVWELIVGGQSKVIIGLKRS